MSDKKQQTAVEWLMEQITYDSSGERWSSFRETVDLKIYFEQAKEMEKQQITDSYIEGCRKGFNEFGENAELYFTKTFTDELP